MDKNNQQKNNYVTTHKIAVLDFETDPFLYGREPEPFCGGVFDGEIYRHVWGKNCVEELVTYIKDNLVGYTIYAHNGGKFDFFFMLEYFDEKITVINGRLSKLSMCDGKIQFRDSYNILPLPLSAYKKDTFDYKKLHVGVREKNKLEILQYLKNDCVYLYEWVHKFVCRFGKKITISGTAFSELKKTSYRPITTYTSYDDIFRPFYFGGRVQTFMTGHITGENVFYDINSAYPYAMTFKHPYGSNVIEKLKIPSGDNGHYFASIKAISRGALPFRDEQGKLQYYDDNVVRLYHVTGWEIITGLKTNTLKIIKVLKVYQHTQTKCFTPFVNTFYSEKIAAKLSGDSDKELHAKLMLNSCYGKFGQDPRRYKDYCLTTTNCVPSDYVSTDEQINNDKKYWKLHAETENGISIWEKPAPSDKFYNVATAASITGFIRAYLWKSICCSDKPIYCDTDSIICKKFNGVVGKKIGDWSLECNINNAYIGGRKFYAVHDTQKNVYKTACKGARLNAEQIIDEIKNGEGFVWTKDSPCYSLKYGARFIKRKITRHF